MMPAEPTPRIPELTAGSDAGEFDNEDTVVAYPDYAAVRIVALALRDQLTAANARAEAAELDAKRYRWLRANMTYRDMGGYTAPNGPLTGTVCGPLTRRWYHDSTFITVDTIDAAIDAMAK